MNKLLFCSCVNMGCPIAIITNALPIKTRKRLYIRDPDHMTIHKFFCRRLQREAIYPFQVLIDDGKLHYVYGKICKALDSEISESDRICILV